MTIFQELDRIWCPRAPGGPSLDPRSATAATIIQSKQVFLAVPSLALLETLPPTGHPGACWKTMPERAQPPAPASNMEVTSSRKIALFQSSPLVKTEQQQEPQADSSVHGRGITDGCETTLWTTVRSSDGVQLSQGHWALSLFSERSQTNTMPNPRWSPQETLVELWETAFQISRKEP